jgi:hypothetical protein
MIRRSGALLALAASLTLVLAAPAAANHTLAHKVSLLQAKINCLQRYPVFAFGDYAYYELGNSSVEVLNTEAPPVAVPVLLENGSITALDFNYGSSAQIATSDAFFLGVKRNSACMSKFPLAPNPVTSARRVTAAKMARLQ